jgi:hypothetical protein
MAVLLKQGQPNPDDEVAYDGCFENHPPAVFVYCCNGGMDKYENAVLVLRPLTLIVIQGGNIVATYDRARVFMATQTPIAPPILF